ncbi:MAG: hypothetical protein NT001_03830, partial [Candidatus Woesearchaeota archaeon]|nr:hypothetical protein [Candidatus Woesearchaeota archaeon]
MTDGINPEKDYSDEFRRMFFRCRESSMSLIDGLEKLIHDSGIFDRFIIPDNPSLFGHHLSEGVYKSVVDVLSSQYSSLINQGMPQQDAYDNIV